MKKPSDDNNQWDQLREQIIGLGEKSIRKSYYPELQNRLAELERFRSLLDQANDMIFTFALPGGHIEDANLTAFRRLNYSRRELLHLTVQDIMPGFPANMRYPEAGENRDTAPQHPTPLIGELKGKNTGRIPIEATVQIKTTDSSSRGIMVARDMTERLEAETALQDSEEKYRQLFNHLPDLFYRADLEGNVTMVSPSVKMIMGYEPEEAIGLNLGRDVYVDVRDREKLLGELKKKGMVNGFRARLRRKDGEVIWISANSRLYTDKSGNILGVEGIIRDITANKQAEEQHLLLSTAISQAAEIVVITDKDGTIQYVNPAFEKETGYASHEIMGQNPRLLKSGQHDPAFYETLWRTITRGNVWSGRFTNKKKDGTLYEEEATITPIRDNEGGIVNFVAVKRNVTREIKMEQQIRQGQKMEAIGTLAGGIAHDFNNILSAILGFGEIAYYDAPEEGQFKDNIKKVIDAGNRAKELVNQILTFSRQTETEPMPVQVKKIIVEVLKLLRASLPTTIKIVNSVKSNEIIMADPTQIHQVLMNLGTNAGHAMHETGGILSITLTDQELDREFVLDHPELQPGRYVKLEVSDTGHGMDPGIMARIFDPFFTTKSKEEGTGMGLSVVHGIVKNHGGTIEVSSELDKGTQFQVYLPVIETEKKEEKANAEPIPLGGKQKILFVDDEDFQVELGRRLLSRLGYMVTTTSSSIDALNRFRENPHGFDLVITDMTMPQLTGDNLSRELKNIRPDIPIIMFTGYSDRMSEAKAEELGIKFFAMKPLVLRQLATMVRNALRDND